MLDMPERGVAFMVERPVAGHSSGYGYEAIGSERMVNNESRKGNAAISLRQCSSLREGSFR